MKDNAEVSIVSTINRALIYWTALSRDEHKEIEKSLTKEQFVHLPNRIMYIFDKSRLDDGRTSRENAAVGFALYNVNAETQRLNVACLFVCKEYRKRRFGSIMLDKIIRDARCDGIAKIVAFVLPKTESLACFMGKRFEAESVKDYIDVSGFRLNNKQLARPIQDWAKKLAKDIKEKKITDEELSDPHYYHILRCQDDSFKMILKIR